MTSAPKPTGGRKRTDDREIKLQPLGKLKTHKVIDQTTAAEHHDEKVPHQNFRDPGGLWEHQVSLAWDQGEWGDLFWLILARIFPSITLPLNTPAQNLNTAQQLNALQGRNINDGKVQALLARVFPDISPLENEWHKVQNQSPREMRNFLVRLEKQYQVIEGTDLGVVAFVDEAKDEILGRLGQLRQQVAARVVGNPAADWRQKYADLQKFPIEKDPIVFLKFYTELVSTIDDLRKQDVSQTRSMIGFLDTQIAALEGIRQQMQGECSRRLDRIKKRIADKIPAGAYAHQEQLKQKIATATEQFRSNLGTSKRLNKELESLNQEKERLEKREPSRLAREKEQKIRETQQIFADQLAKDQKELPQQIAQLKENIASLQREQRSLLDIKEGKVTVTDFAQGKLSNRFQVPVPFTQQEQLDRLEDGLGELQKELNRLTTELPLLQAVSEQNQGQAINEIETVFAHAIRQNEASVTSLTKRIEALSPEQQKAQQTYEQANRTLERLEKEKQDFKTEWDAALSTQQMQGDCQDLTSLLFLEEAFTAYQDIKTQDPYSWLSNHYRETSAPFKAKLFDSLHALGVHEDSPPYRDAQNESGRVYLRRLGADALQQLPLPEFH